VPRILFTSADNAQTSARTAHYRIARVAQDSLLRIGCDAWSGTSIGVYFLTANRHTKIWFVTDPARLVQMLAGQTQHPVRTLKMQALSNEIPNQMARSRPQAGYVSRFHLSCRSYL
jgi:hypothetical protein